MRLADLSPTFLQAVDVGSFRTSVSRADADGVMFDCPKCAGTPHGHVIICWTPSVEPERTPGPGRWSLVGTTFEDLSLVAASSSVLVTTGCKAHFFVRDGAIVDC